MLRSDLLLTAFLIFTSLGCRAGSSAITFAAANPAPATTTAQSGGEGLFLNGFFPIGVFSQPQDSFVKWKSRGINTILETPQGHDPVSWDRAAQSAGLYIIRRPMKDPRQDIGRKDLLAWSHWDEPDAAGRIAEWTPMFERTAKEWRAIDPNRKIFINFAGPDLSWFTTRSDAYSKNYASYYPRLLATADWIANDLYPSGGWLNQAHAPRRGDITLIGEPIRILRGMTQKPQFAFIEASEIERGNVEGARCPTVAEFKAQIWYALIQGVRGLFYFPAVVGKGGFRFDGSPPEIVEVMTQQNTLIAKIAPLLQAEINPMGFSAEAPSGIAAGWRKNGRNLLYIFVNTSRSPVNGARIKVNGLGRVKDGISLSANSPVTISGGVLHESFEPLGVRVIQFSLP